MVGRNTGDNKFGLTPFIVGKTLGDGCNYAGGAGLQQAINDCAAAGGGVVGIRPSTTSYVVNLSLKGNVDLIAYHADGRIPTGLSHVQIEGQHTWNATSGGAEEIVVENINWVDPNFGDLFTINATGGTVAVFASKFCSSVTNSGAGAGRSFVINPDLTSAIIVAKQAGNTSAGQRAFECIGTGSAQIQIANSSDIAASADAAILFTSGTCSVSIVNSSITSTTTYCVEDKTGSGQIAAEFSVLNAGIAAVSFTVAGGSFTAYQTVINAGGANYVVGTGTFTHADTVLVNAKTLAGTVTEVKTNWQPYASAGTSVTAYRGTAGFDSTQFSVTDGFVTLLGGGEAIDSIGVQASTPPGTNPVVPTVAGLVTINGAGVTAQSIPVQSNSLAANTLQIEVQRASGQPGSDATKAGICSFFNQQFTVDSNGFVTEINGLPIVSIDVDAHTAPGTDPVVPSASGVLIMTGAQVATGTIGANVIRTDSLAANTLTIEIQRSTAVAATDSTKNGVSHFNSGQFSVDANGFVSVINGGFLWNDVLTATQTLAVQNGYVTDRGAGVTYTLPATAALGDEIRIVGKLGLATITPNANQQILMSSASGAVGATGTVVSTNVGDCIDLICITAGASTVWRASNWVGNWTVNT